MTVHEIHPRHDTPESLREAGASWALPSRGSAAARPALPVQPEATAAPPVAPASGPSAADEALLKLLKDDSSDAPSFPRRLLLERLLRGVQLRWRLVALVLLAMVSGGVGIATLTVPRQWLGTATLIVSDRKAVLNVGGGQPYQTRDYGLDTLVDTLKLPSSLDEAMRRSGVVATRLALSNAIKVTESSKSDVLNLRVTWKSPREAASLANNLADVFVERTTRIRADQAGRDFATYQRQLDEARQRLATVDNEMETFQRQNQVSSLDDQAKLLALELSRVQMDHWASEGTVEALRAARGDLQKALDSAPATVTSTLFRNPIGKRLEDTEWQLKEARTRYTEENPKVINLREQAEALKALSAHSEFSGGETTRAPNELRRDLKVKIEDLTTQLHVAEGHESGLATAIDHMQARLGEMTTLGKAYRDLQARQQAARDLERGLAAKADETRVAMEGGEPSLQLVERAMVPSAPERSKRRAIVLAATVLGAIMAILLALGLELTDRRVRCREDIEDYVEPTGVSAEVPHVPPEEAQSVNLTSLPFRPFRRFVNDLHASSGDWATLAIVSAGPGEGRSTVARDMALCLAARGEKTALIDGDLRADCGPRSVTAGGPGLAEILERGSALESCVQRGAHERLSVVPAGVESLDVASPLLLGHPEAALALRSVLARGRRVILDLPPAGECDGGFELACQAGSVILATRYGLTGRHELDALSKRLRARGVRIVGAVILDVPPDRQHPYAGVSFASQVRAECRSFIQKIKRRPARA